MVHDIPVQLRWKFGVATLDKEGELIPRKGASVGISKGFGYIKTDVNQTPVIAQKPTKQRVETHQMFHHLEQKQIHGRPEAQEKTSTSNVKKIVTIFTSSFIFIHYHKT